MIAFGCAVTQPDAYERWAAPGIARAREPDSAVYPNLSAGSIFRAYNLLLDQAATHEDLEALVLLHQDVEIVDEDFCGKVRAVLSDSDVAIAGCVGARDARSLAWWEGSVTWASFTHRYYEYGGGEIYAFAMRPDRETPPDYARTGEVDTLDGFIMVLSSWSVRNLRFDETLGEFDGYDFDICMQAREAGRKVVAEHLEVVHHHSIETMPNAERWIEANLRVIDKWENRLPRIGEQIGAENGDWKKRARRAESDASATRALLRSAVIRASARESELLRDIEGKQAEIESIKASTSWRLTEPMRRISQGFLRGRHRA